MPILAERIESYLDLDKGGVHARSLCNVFDLRARQLRADATKPGLCSGFAISGPLGFRHVHHCTDAEWQEFYARMRGHAISELTRVSILRKRRAIRAASEASAFLS